MPKLSKPFDVESPRLIWYEFTPHINSGCLNFRSRVDETRNRSAGMGGFEAIGEKVPNSFSLLATGFHDAPDVGQISGAGLALGAVTLPSPDHAVTDRALGGVVRRLHAVFERKTEQGDLSLGQLAARAARLRAAARLAPF